MRVRYYYSSPFLSTKHCEPACVSFGYTTKALKNVLKALDQETLSIRFQDGILQVPEFTKIWDKASSNMFFTHNIKLSKKINKHWFFHQTKAKQLELAEKMILQNAKKDGLEAIITDLDGVVFNEQRKFNHFTNIKKAPWFTFLMKTKLVNKFPKHSVKVYDNLDIQFLENPGVSILPYMAKFIHTMQANNIKVFGLTGRPNILKEATKRNLRNYNLHLDDLFIKNGHDKTIAGDYRDFKVATMQKVTNQYKLLGILGDNQGDLLPRYPTGFNVENIKHTVQVLFSNPFYKTKFKQ